MSGRRVGALPLDTGGRAAVRVSVSPPSPYCQVPRRRPSSMGRKITLFRFDVDAGRDPERRTEEEQVTVERPAEVVEENEDDDEGGSLVRRLLLGGLLLAVGAAGGFVFRGTEKGNEVATQAKSAVPFVGDEQAAEPTPDEGAKRGTASLVGFGFLVSLTALLKRLNGARPIEES